MHETVWIEQAAVDVYIFLLCEPPWEIQTNPEAEAAFYHFNIKDHKVDKRKITWR